MEDSDREGYDETEKLRRNKTKKKGSGGGDETVQQNVTDVSSLSHGRAPTEVPLSPAPPLRSVSLAESTPSGGSRQRSSSSFLSPLNRESKQSGSSSPQRTLGQHQLLILAIINRLQSWTIGLAVVFQGRRSLGNLRRSSSVTCASLSKSS